MEIKRMYEESSGVNIDTAHKQYDAERASGYDGEFQLFKHLLNNDSFKYSKLLTNLVIPSGNGNSTTEIDMVLITQYGIIVFEVKNYKGTIYGKIEDKYWTQYFKTVSNNRFNNPIKQNEYHIQALKRLLPQKIFSVIFFSNPYCDTRRVEFSNGNCTVVNNKTLDNILHTISQSSQEISTHEIDTIFENLKKYTSATTSKDTYASSKINDFDAFFKQSQEYLNKEVEKQSTESKKKFIKKAKIISIISAIVVIFCLFACLVLYEERNKALAQYDSMNENFSIVSESDIKLSESLLDVTDVSITPHDYLEGSYLSFVIKNTSETAHISYHPSSTYSELPSIFITLNDGSVQEYPLEGTWYSISPEEQRTHKIPISCTLEEIKYIKMQTLYVVNGYTYTHSFAINIYEQ